jgi:hypothetical protein
MKKLLVLAALLAAAVGMGWADAVTGTSPVTHPVTFTVIIPGQLGINIPTPEHNWTLDLTLDPTWPPAVTTPYSITNNATIQVLSTRIYSYSYTASMTTVLANLTVGDFQYDAVGWFPSWAGWQTFGASGTFEAAAPATTGWLNRNMRYRVNLDGTEAEGTGVMTLAHIMAQP